MKIPESITKERPADVESATASSTDPNILSPLQFLLAARRGVRADPTFANIHIPDEKVLLYAGESGVKAINNDSIVTRLLFNIGYIGKPWMLCFWAFYMSFFVSGIMFSTSDEDRGDGEGRGDTGFMMQLRVAGYAALAMCAFLVAARVYSKKAKAAATPPHLDRDSYQYRLVEALEQREMEFRDVITAPLRDMEILWRQDQSLQEKFSIEGLVDAESSGVYDVVVRFWNNGNVNFQFASDSAPKTKSGVLLQPPKKA